MTKKTLIQVRTKTHGEVNDTEPEGHITDEVNKVLKENGYDFKINRFEF